MRGMPVSLYRCLGIALAAICFAFPDPHLEHLFFVVTVTHYIVSLAYSGGPARRLLDRRTLWPRAALILAVTAWTAYSRVPDMTRYFGLHFILTEAYLLPVARQSLPRPRWALACRYTLALCLYFSFVGPHPVINPFSKQGLAVGYVVALGFFMAWLWASRGEIPRRAFAEFVVTDLLGLGLIGLAQLNRGDWRLPILFHVLAWLFIPLPSLARRGRAALARYTALNLGCLAILTALTPLGGGWLGIPYPRLREGLVIGAYVHIGLSFLLSSYNPERLVRWLGGDPRAVTT